MTSESCLLSACCKLGDIPLSLERKHGEGENRWIDQQVIPRMETRNRSKINQSKDEDQSQRQEVKKTTRRRRRRRIIEVESSQEEIKRVDQSPKIKRSVRRRLNKSRSSPTTKSTESDLMSNDSSSQGDDEVIEVIKKEEECQSLHHSNCPSRDSPLRPHSSQQQQESSSSSPSLLYREVNYRKKESPKSKEPARVNKYLVPFKESSLDLINLLQDEEEDEDQMNDQDSQESSFRDSFPSVLVTEIPEVYYSIEEFLEMVIPDEELDSTIISVHASAIQMSINQKHFSVKNEESIMIEIIWLECSFCKDVNPLKSILKQYGISFGTLRQRMRDDLLALGETNERLIHRLVCPTCTIGKNRGVVGLKYFFDISFVLSSRFSEFQSSIIGRLYSLNANLVFGLDPKEAIISRPPSQRVISILSSLCPETKEEKIAPENTLNWMLRVEPLREKGSNISEYLNNIITVSPNCLSQSSVSQTLMFSFIGIQCQMTDESKLQS